MKHRSDNTQPKDTEQVRQDKKPYEKPQLGKVILFADQVLARCNAPLTCPTPDPSMS